VAPPVIVFTTIYAIWRTGNVLTYFVMLASACLPSSWQYHSHIESVIYW